MAVPLLVAVCIPASVHASHPCASDARFHAEQLLSLHGEVTERTKILISNELRLLEPIPAVVGDGLLDVLEVEGHIYRTNYRMRFIYAQFPESCVLVGQEILELADPY